MDSYERFVRAINFEEPDRVATWSSPLINMRIIKELGGSGPAERSIPKAYRKLGIDATRGGIGFPPSTEKTFVTNRYGGLICEKNFTFKVVPREATFWMVNTPYKTLDDLYEISLEPLPRDQIEEEHFIRVSKCKRAFEKEGVVFCDCLSLILDGTISILGWSLFVRARYQAIDELRKLMEKIASIESIKAKVDAELDFPAVMYGDDIAYKNGLMINPEFLRREWAPLVKKVIEPLKKRNIKVLFHSDGNLEGFIEDIINMGFEGLNPIEPAAGMDIGSVKRRYGEKLVLLGNIDGSTLLPFGTPEGIKSETIKCIHKAAPGSGFCLASSSAIHNGIPL
ncbi:MAG: uroporphyrinogen decarboxylase family protein, partial [Candidatus Baldrarchaeia archaeon]